MTTQDAIDALKYEPSAAERLDEVLAKVKAYRDHYRGLADRDGGTIFLVTASRFAACYRDCLFLAGEEPEEGD